MKITVKPLEQKPVAFKSGDYFLTDAGSLRQIVQIQFDKYAIIDPKIGVKTIGETRETAQKLIEYYVSNNGSVKKVALVEIVVQDVGEGIKRKW